MLSDICIEIYNNVKITKYKKIMVEKVETCTNAAISWRTACRQESVMSQWGTKTARLAPNGTNLGSVFSTFWLDEPKCTEN